MDSLAAATSGPDARVVGATLEAGQELTWETEPHRHVYAVPATGVIEVDGKRINARDGIAFTGGSKVVVKSIEGPAEIVLTDAL